MSPVARCFGAALFRMTDLGTPLPQTWSANAIKPLTTPPKVSDVRTREEVVYRSIKVGFAVSSGVRRSPRLS